MLTFLVVLFAIGVVLFTTLSFIGSKYPRAAMIATLTYAGVIVITALHMFFVAVLSDETKYLIYGLLFCGGVAAFAEEYVKRNKNNG